MNRITLTQGLHSGFNQQSDIELVIEKTKEGKELLTKEEVEEYRKIDPITQVLDIIKEKKYATEAEIETIDQRVNDLVAECEKFAEESPFPEAQQLYDVVYEQENYPFIPHRL